MITIRALYLLTALVLGLFAIEPSYAVSQGKLSLEQILPSHFTPQDYRFASKSLLQLANEHSRRNEPMAACEELAKSLDYYRKALATDDHSAQATFVYGDDGDGMQQVRSRFGCTRTQLS
jgi:hypothetical protein